MTEIFEDLTAPQLAQALAAGADLQLLDVREPFEHEIARLEGATLIPLGHLALRAGELDSDRPVVCVCHHGNRSRYACMMLHQLGFRQIKNLQGGLEAWHHLVDPAVPLY